MRRTLAMAVFCAVLAGLSPLFGTGPAAAAVPENISRSGAGGNHRWSTAPNWAKAEGLSAAVAPSTFSWTGAGGNWLWSDPLNWEDRSGVQRVPGPEDHADLQNLGSDAEAVVVDVPVTVAELSMWSDDMYDPEGPQTTDLVVAQPLVVTRSAHLFAKTEVTSELSSPYITTIGTMTIADGGVVRVTPTGLASRPPTIVMGGRVELQGSGAFANTERTYVLMVDPLAAAADPTEIIGVPSFHDTSLDLASGGRGVTGVIEMTGDTEIESGATPSGLELRLRPDSSGRLSLTDRVALADTDVPLTNLGTIDIDATGALNGPAEIILHDPMTNTGTLRLAGDVNFLGGALLNEGTMLVAASSEVHLAADPDGVSNRNDGRVVLDSNAELESNGGLVNDGQMDSVHSDFRLAVVVLREGDYSGTGGGTAWLHNKGVTMTPGPAVAPFTTTSWTSFTQTQSGLLRLRVGGIGVDATQRLEIGNAALNGTLEVVLTDAVICPGDTVALMTWEAVSGTFTTVEVSNGPGWLSFEPVYTATGLSVRAVGTPNDGTCGDTDEAFVREMYLDVLGRTVDPGALAHWRERLVAGTTRTQIANVLTASGEYRRRVVTDEYQRFLARAPDSGGMSYWTDHLAQGRSVDTLRSLLAGSTEFWVKAGSTPARFADRVYLTVLARTPDSGGKAFIIHELSIGRSRASLAGWYTRTPEADTRQLTRYWQQLLHRNPTSVEAAPWRDGFATRPEARTVAGIVGSQPFLQHLGG